MLVGEHGLEQLASALEPQHDEQDLVGGLHGTTANGNASGTKGSTQGNSQEGGVLGATASAGSSGPEGGVLGAIESASGGVLPFTGFPLWLAMVVALALIVLGLALRRRARATT